MDACANAQSIVKKMFGPAALCMPRRSVCLTAVGGSQQAAQAPADQLGHAGRGRGRRVVGQGRAEHAGDGFVVRVLGHAVAGVGGAGDGVCGVAVGPDHGAVAKAGVAAARGRLVPAVQTVKAAASQSGRAAGCSDPATSWHRQGAWVGGRAVPLCRVRLAASGM